MERQVSLDAVHGAWDGGVDGATADVNWGQKDAVRWDADSSDPEFACGEEPLVLLASQSGAGAESNTPTLAVATIAGTTIGGGDGAATDRRDCGDTDNARWGHGSPDRRLGFVPTVSGNYRFEVSADFNAALTVTEGCPDDEIVACEGFSRPPHSEANHGLEMMLEAGKRYVVTVDGALEDMPDAPHLYDAAFGIALVPQVIDEVYEPMLEVLGYALTLALESGRDGHVDGTRAVFDASFQRWMVYVDHMSLAASIDGVQVADGTAGVDGTVGLWVGTVESTSGRRDLHLPSARASGLGLIGIGVDSLANSQTAKDSLDTAIDALSWRTSDLAVAAELASQALRRRSGAFRLRVMGPCDGACPATPACVPTCDGRSCGGDGCGGKCGACSETEACLDGACEETPWCEPQPDVLRCGETVQAQRRRQVGTANELIWSLEALAEEGVVTVRQRGLFHNDFLNVFSQPPPLLCSDPPQVSSGPGGVTFLAQAGLPYSVRLGIGNTAERAEAFGPFAFEGDPLLFDLEVSCCVPDCEGKGCGSDGCGGMCGLAKCTYCRADGLCKYPAAQCLPALPLACGQTQTGVHLDSPMVQAPDAVSPHAHLAFELTPETSGDVTLSSDAPVWSMTRLRVADFGESTCADAAATAADAAATDEPDADASWVVAEGFGEVTFEGTAGHTYRIYVEDTIGTHLKPRPTFSLTTECPK